MKLNECQCEKINWFVGRVSGKNGFSGLGLFCGSCHAPYIDRTIKLQEQIDNRDAIICNLYNSGVLTNADVEKIPQLKEILSGETK